MIPSETAGPALRLQTMGPSTLRRRVVAIAQRSWWLGVPIFLTERLVWQARRWLESLPEVPWGEAEINRVRRDGVVVVPGYLDDGLCRLLKREVDRVIAKHE